MPRRHLPSGRGQIWCNGPACRRSSSWASASTRTSAAYDNVVMNGIMLGLSPREARKRYEQRDRVRRARGVPGPQAQELLLGHARAPRVLGGDPGRRRHPADRRGARGRRRRLPAEVLRRVQRPARRRTHDRVRHPRHGLPSSASVTARCCSSAARSVELGEPARGGRPLPRAQLRSRRRLQRAGRRSRARWRRRRRGSSTCGWRTSPASGSTIAPQQQPATLKALRRVQRRRPRPVRAALYDLQRGAPRGDRRRPRAHATTSAAGHSDAGEEAVFAFTFDNVLAPGRYTPSFTSPTAAPGST